MLHRYRKRKKIASISIIILLVILAIFKVFATKRADIGEKNTKDTLVVVLDSKIQSTDPRLIGGDANSQYIEQLRFLPLVGANEKGNIQNYLAKSIEPISRTALKISLKQGIKFHNGKIITARDVVATYQAIIEPKSGFPVSPRRAAFANVTLFKEISPYEIQVELKEPDASFLTNLVIGILPAEAILNAEANDINEKGYESGPYLLSKKYATDLILIRNENYNFGTLALMPKIDFKIISDSGTRYAALMRGDIDIAQNALDPDKITLIQKELQNKFEVISTAKLSTTYLAFNFRNPVFQKIEVREAIAAAIDRTTILQYRLQGQGILATGMFPPSHAYFDNSIPAISYDPSAAKLLLEKSRVPLPLKFTIKVSNSNRSTVELAKAIASNLRTIGIYTSVEMLENNIFLDQVKRGNAQMWIAPWLGFKDPDHLRFVFASDMKPPAGGNRGAYTNTEVDSLLQAGREENDPSKRKMIYDEAQELLSQELPYVYLWHNLNVVVSAKNVTGFTPYADGRYWSLAQTRKQ